MFLVQERGRTIAGFTNTDDVRKYLWFKTLPEENRKVRQVLEQLERDGEIDLSEPDDIPQHLYNPYLDAAREEARKEYQTVESDDAPDWKQPVTLVEEGGRPIAVFLDEKDAETFLLRKKEVDFDTRWMSWLNPKMKEANVDSVDELPRELRDQASARIRAEVEARYEWRTVEPGQAAFVTSPYLSEEAGKTTLHANRPKTKEVDEPVHVQDNAGVISIHGQECIKVAEWVSGDDSYLLGNSVVDHDFYYALVNGSTYFEYDYKPQQAKVEDDFIDYTAEQFLDCLEAGEPEQANALMMGNATYAETKTQQLTPDNRMTGEQVRTPRGSFHVTNMTAEQMKNAGYGLHHTSEDGKYLIMGNGTQAFAILAEQPENHLKVAEQATGQKEKTNRERHIRRSR